MRSICKYIISYPHDEDVDTVFLCRRCICVHVHSKQSFGIGIFYYLMGLDIFFRLNTNTKENVYDISKEYFVTVYLPKKQTLIHKDLTFIVLNSGICVLTKDDEVLVTYNINL